MSNVHGEGRIRSVAFSISTALDHSGMHLHACHWHHGEPTACVVEEDYPSLTFTEVIDLLIVLCDEYRPGSLGHQGDQLSLFGRIICD